MIDPFVEFDPKNLPLPPHNVFLTFSVFATGVFLGGAVVGAFLA
jgi:hypothetical protein